MPNYPDQFYAKFGYKYIPTGRTGADWDQMGTKCADQSLTLNRLRHIVLGINAEDKSDHALIEAVARMVLEMKAAK